jgi:hypothetical protein
MHSLLRIIVRLLWPPLVMLVAVPIVAAYSLPSSPIARLSVPLIVVQASFMYVISVFEWRNRYWNIARLYWQSRKLQRRTTARFCFYFAQEAGTAAYWDAYFAYFETELDRLDEQFGFSLPRPVTIFLFRTREEVRTFHTRQVVGFAEPLVNTVVLTVDTNLREAISHELVHLFSDRWNRRAPALLHEGLSTWMQPSCYSLSLDEAVAPDLRNREISLSKLVQNNTFHSEPPSRYVVAGSFTGFLIRRFGWERYRTFYRSAFQSGFARRFQKFFGLSLAEAEARWRNEVLAMSVLRKRLTRGCL